MANSFHHVTQSLRGDDGRVPLTALLVTVLLTAGWLVWIFKAHVTRYEISDSARLESASAGNRIVAEFEPSALARLRPGQQASVRFQGFSWPRYGVVSARILNIAGDIRDGKLRVELVIDPAIQSRAPLPNGMPATVEVAIEQLTPAALVLRSAGVLASAH